MLINFSESVKRYKMHITGIIQAGAHWGEEVESYLANGIENIKLFEPCREAFGVLQEKFISYEHIYLHNIALGSYTGLALMNVETANNGQSNSILAPKLHLVQHPSIVFNKQEEVAIRELDKMTFKRHIYNMLVMDCQGYEYEILKGATESLKYIDYVYTEVNRDEVYQGCAKIQDIDIFLANFNFIRVEVKWVGNWGDAIYIRRNLL